MKNLHTCNQIRSKKTRVNLVIDNEIIVIDYENKIKLEEK